jgi:deoxyinosine 3'endonuclease (endonuclease V)
LVPQVIFVDGNGIYHPMKMGLASHLGVLANIPTIGVSKNYLYFDDMNISNDEIKEKLKGFESVKEYIELVGKSGFIYGAVR